MEKKYKNKKFDGQMFFEREHILKRIYTNRIDDIVLIWKCEKDKMNPECEPYRIISITQFMEEYKRFL